MGFGALKSRIAHFKEDLRGTILVEFVIISPVFIMLIAMGFEFFDAFKSYNRAQKASYTIADMVSRDTEFGDSDMQMMHAFLDGLLPWMNGKKGLRISSLSYEDGKYSVAWSDVTKRGYKELVAKDLTGDIAGKLPDIAENDTVIVIETWVPHRPLIDLFDMSDIVWENTIVIRPRYVREIKPI